MNTPNRKSPRLKNYDYSKVGYYFITICTEHKKCIFADYSKPSRLSLFGQIANDEIANIEKHYSNVNVDKYIVMPNHVHLLISLSSNPGSFSVTANDIPNIVGKYKAGVTRIIRKNFPTASKTLFWQVSYHDHIVRNENDYLKIWQYIDTNPLKWEEDCFYSVDQ